MTRHRSLLKVYILTLSIVQKLFIKLRIDPNRDVDRARYRYLQLTKTELVDRLLGVEQAYAELQQQCAQLQFQVLEQGLRKVEEQKQAHGQPKRKGGKTTKRDGTGER